MFCSGAAGLPAGRGGAGPLPSMPPKFPGSCGILSENKFYFFHAEREENVERVSLSDFCSLIACLIPGLWVQRGLHKKHIIHHAKHIRKVFGGVNFEKVPRILVWLIIRWRNDSTNNESRRKFFKKQSAHKKWTEFRLLKDFSFLVHLCMRLLKGKLGRIVHIVHGSARIMTMS